MWNDPRWSNVTINEFFAKRRSFLIPRLRSLDEYWGMYAMKWTFCKVLKVQWFYVSNTINHVNFEVFDFTLFYFKSYICWMFGYWLILERVQFKLSPECFPVAFGPFPVILEQFKQKPFCSKVHLRHKFQV